MYEKQIKDLKDKKKDVLKNMEILDKNMKRGAISASEYFQEFDKQKALLSKIKNKIQDLEPKKEEEREPVLVEEEQIIEVETSAEDFEEKKDSSLKEKIKSHLPKGLKFKFGTNTSHSDSLKEVEIKKIPSVDVISLRNYKFFREKQITLDDHPNFIQLTLRSFLEDLEYKINKIKKPLAELIELNQEKSRIIEYDGYLIGTKKATLTDSNEYLLIFIRQEGICSIFFDGKRVNTQTKVNISVAGNCKNIDDEELEKDITALYEKIHFKD